MHLVIIKLSAIFCVYSSLFILEHLRPYFKARDSHTIHSIQNILLALTNLIVSLTLFIVVLYQVFLFTDYHQLGLLNHISTHETVKLIIAIILIDLWQYFWHRLNHISPLLWKFHRVHHADKELDASSGVRFHPGEILLSGLARILMIPLLGIHLNHLVTYEIIMIMIVFFHHSNICLHETVDNYLRILIVTPHMHRLHHSSQKTETDSNFGNIFSLWDKIFNTYIMRSIKNNFALGLGSEFNKTEWSTYLGMLKIPFK